MAACGNEKPSPRQKTLEELKPVWGEKVKAKLDMDLQGAAGKAIVAGIQQRWPGAKTPFNWGFGW